MSATLDFLTPLFVPANRPERFEKAATSEADAIILDLEDAVSPEEKETARSLMRDDFTGKPVLVRVNGTGTPWHLSDMAALAGRRFTAVIVPKAERGRAFSTLCAEASLPVIALIESAAGLAAARWIAALEGVARLAFGSIDFCADVGCAHSREALLAARSELVLASRLAAIPAPIDGVTTIIDDAALVSSDARHASDLGFGGKLCIHPRQIEAVRAGFAPDAIEIAWARKVLTSGDGAAAVDGAMVDAPVRIRARALLRRAASANVT